MGTEPHQLDHLPTADRHPLLTFLWEHIDFCDHERYSDPEATRQAALEAIVLLHRPTGHEEEKRCDVCRDDYGIWPCLTIRVLANAFRNRPGFEIRWLS